MRWASDRPLAQFSPAGDDRAVDVDVRRVPRLVDRPGGVVVGNGRVFDDGARFTFGPTTFDTFGGDRVEWCGPDEDVVPAALYGTVVAILLAWRGRVPLHASAVEIDGHAVLIAGPSGAGKSTLCHALAHQGGRLVSDDLSALLPATAPGIPLLLPGRSQIRLVRAGTDAASGEKELHPAPLTDPDIPVPLTTLVVLGRPEPPRGPLAAHQALAAQVFRPRWMRALPFSRDRAATMMHVAARLDVFGAPSAADRPEVPVAAKVDAILARMARTGPPRLDVSASMGEGVSRD